MKQYGIRQAKAHLSEIARAAAQGVCSIVTDNRKPVAMIGPPPVAPVEPIFVSTIVEEAESLSDPVAFRKALFNLAHPIEFDF